MSPQKLFVCYHLPTRDEQELSLGMLMHCKRIFNFFMLHACFVHIPTCFMCTFIHFLAFSGTNLLTRCRSASSCFLLSLVSEKFYRKYSRNGTRKKPKFLICRREDGVRRGAEGRPQGGQTCPGRGP